MTRCRTEVGVLALEVIVGVAVLLGVAWLATGRFETLDDEPADTADLGLPTDRLLRSDDIPRLRFRAVGGIRGGLRGYRMSDVDQAMDQVHAALRAAEDRATGPTRAAAPAGEESRVSASPPEPPIRPVPSPTPERPLEPEPLPPHPPEPMQPEPHPSPEPPLAEQPAMPAESEPLSTLEDTYTSRPVEGE